MTTASAAAGVDSLLYSVDIRARIRRDWEHMARCCDYRIQIIDEFETLALAPLSCKHVENRVRGCFDETDYELPPWIQTPDGAIAWFTTDEGFNS